MKIRSIICTFSIIYLLTIFSCGTRTVTMNAMRPAEISFPSYVNKLLLVDRTKFEKPAVNIIEGLITGEMPGEDRGGLENAMNSFQTTLMASPRFQLKRATEVLVGNSITSAFPAPLQWAKVEELCNKYGADAIVAIEIFDTDFIITDGKRKVKKQIDENGVKKEVELDEFYAQGIGNATIGFRLYDPKTKSVADQQLFTKTNTWNAVGNSTRDAIAHLVAKTEATRYVGGLAGNDYAYKISPMPIKITRQFYGKSKKAPKIAAGSRQADVNDWNGAIKTWESGLNTADQKNAGKLSYNIAIANEVLGDLDNAKNWANQAYVKYGNKKARSYFSLIESRKRQEEVVKQQMN